MSRFGRTNPRKSKEIQARLRLDFLGFPRISLEWSRHMLPVSERVRKWRSNRLEPLETGARSERPAVAAQPGEHRLGRLARGLDRRRFLASHHDLVHEPPVPKRRVGANRNERMRRRDGGERIAIAALR